MRYQGPDDPRLPAHVKGRSREERQAWCAVFESTWDATASDRRAQAAADALFEALELPESTVVLEADGSLRAILIREGESKNRNVWSRQVLEQMVPLCDGVPVHFYDMSRKGDGTFLAHWEQLRPRVSDMLRRALPPAVATMLHLPERLPGATVGAVREPRLTEGNDGRAQIEGRIELTKEAGWFRSFFESLTRSGRSLGLSIHAPADGVTSVLERAGNGLRRVIRSVTRVVGFDVVTHPSAGGGFLPVMESLLEEDRTMDLIKKLLQLLTEEKRAALKPPTDAVESFGALVENHEEFVKAYFEALGQEYNKAVAPALLESLSRIELPEPKASEPAKKAQASAPASTPATPAVEGKANAPDVTALQNQITQVSQQVSQVLRDNCRALIEAEIKAAELPKETAEFARGELEARMKGAGVLEAEAIKTFVGGLKKASGGNQRSSILEGANPVAVQMGLSSGEKAEAALMATIMGAPYEELEVNGKKERIPAFEGIRKAYGIMTGDVYCEGRAFYQRPKNQRMHRGALEGLDLSAIPIVQEYLARGGSLVEAMTTSSFALILASTLHRAMLRFYRREPQQWRLIASPERVTDFRVWHYQRLGTYGDFSVVTESSDYADVGASNEPSEDSDITLQVRKRGGLTKITWEMLVNDDLGAIRQLPRLFAEASHRTLEHHVWGLLLNNSAIYDSVTLAHASSHGANLVTTDPPVLATIKSMRRTMVKQQDLDSNRRGVCYPRQMFCGPETYETLYELIYSDRKPSLAGTDTNNTAGTPDTLTSDNPNIPNVARGDYGLQLHEILYFEDVDPDQYWMTSAPAEVDMIKVGFLNGKEEPELFVQDLQNVGSFFDSDEITYKCRHIYEAEVVDYRPFVGGIPA